MDRRVKFSLLAIALFLGSILTAYVAFQAAPLDPLAEFRTADGSLSFPGGKFTPELQRLLSPAKVPTSYWTYAAQRSAYPTLSVEGTEHVIPRATVAPQPLRPVGTDSFKVFFAALAQLPKSIVSFFDSINPIGTAAAADRFLVLGDTDCTATLIATDTDCWATTSGGTDVTTVPGSSDRALLDVASGVGTGTMNAAMNVLEWCSADACNGAAAAFAGTIVTGNFAVTIGTGGYTQAGTFTAGSSTITVSGNWNSSTGTWNRGTSTLVFAASGNWTSGGDIDGASFCNVTVNISVTTTMTTASRIIAAACVITVNGTLTGAQTLGIRSSAQASFVRGASGSISGVGFWNYRTENNGTTDIPAATYPALTFQPAALTRTFQATGAVIATSLSVIGGSTFVKGTQTLTVNGALTLGSAGTTNSITSTSGDVSVSGNVVVFGAADFIDFGSEAWVISGTWTNSTTSASWDAGTGTVTFASATGGTMTFAGSNLAEDEFNNVTFTSSAGTSQTFTMATRGLRFGGTLTITDSSGGTILAKATLTLTGGALTISGTAASGLTSTSGSVIVSTVSASTATAFIDFGSESWTVSGAWTNSSTSSSWERGTGTVTFNATTDKTMTFSGSSNFVGGVEFNNLTFTSSAATFVTFTQSGSLKTLGTLTVIDTTTCTQPTPPSGQNCTGLSTDASSDTLGGYLVDTGGIVFWNNSPTVTMNGNYIIQNGGRQQSVFNRVIFAATATIGDSDPNQNAMYNITINVGVSVTNTTTFNITNVAVINGTLLGGSPNNPQLQFVVFGLFTNSGAIVTLGGSSDVSQSGYFVYVFAGPGLANYTVAAGHYQHLAILGNSGRIVDLAGNIDTTDGGACAAAADGSACAVVIAGYSINDRITFNTNNNNMLVGGVLWFGDLASQHVDANLGSSTITTGDSFDVLANSNVNFQSATLILNRFAGETNVHLQALSTEFQGQIDMGTANVTVNGNIRMNAYGTPPGQRINFSGATVSVSGGVLIDDPIDYMNFGSAVITVGGTWTNESTSASWSAGTGAVTFASSIDRTMTFAGSNLPGNEFNSVVFSSTANGVDYTMATRNLRANSITISDSTTTVSLVTGALDLIFVSMDIDTNGTLTMNGISVITFEMSTDSGSITLTDWSAYNEGAQVTAAWTFNPSSAGATVTITAELVPGFPYNLFRDSVLVSSQTANSSSGTVTFAVTGGWSPHAMAIERGAGTGGGGGGVPPPGNQPTFVPAEPSQITPINIAIFIMAVGALMVLGGFLFRSRALRFWGVLIFVAGLIYYLVLLGYL
jgi:hypothetical protein